MPTHDGSPAIVDEHAGEPVRRGPQHRECQRTACCVCFTLWWRRVHGERDASKATTVPDWTELPQLGEDAPDGESHHEPEGIHATDNRTVPLCGDHHRLGFYARHRVGPAAFWAYFRINPDDVCDEMRRRVAATVPPSTWIPAGASEPDPSPPTD
jgi:hypothetical protein